MELTATTTASRSSSAPKTSAHFQIHGKTIADAYYRRIQSTPQQTFYLQKNEDRYEPVSWEQAHDQILRILAGLKAAKVQPGQSVAILSHSRPEWLLTDIAVMSLGAVVVPIYPSSTEEEITYVLEHSDAQLLFVDADDQAAKLPSVFKALGRTIPVVSFDKLERVPEGVSAQSLQELMEEAPDPEVYESLIHSVHPDQIASIVYTSGTTGKPKGVLLSHSNFSVGIRATIDAVRFTSDDRTLTFLPFSHIFGRVEGLAAIFCGFTVGFAENVSTVSQNILEVKPTLLVSVPRIYEKIHSKILMQVESGPTIKKRIFGWATEIGRELARLESDQVPAPLSLKIKGAVARNLVLDKVAQKMGGQIRLTASGGAPLSQDLCEFFHACGIRIMEGYGLTETLGPILVNTPGEHRFGTVGKPLKTAEVRIAPDGEILLRGGMVFQGYHKNPEATSEAFTEDGWFRTGDIGEIDEKGYLRITDRKKELIITAGGKNIAPQKIENALKQSQWISCCMIYGDREKYLTALITLDEEAIIKFAKSKGLGTTSLAELSQHPTVRALIENEVAEVNQHLASFETIKKFTLLPNDFTIETGELTPSLKIKRKVITKKFHNEIRSMY